MVTYREYRVINEGLRESRKNIPASLLKMQNVIKKLLESL